MFLLVPAIGKFFSKLLNTMASYLSELSEKRRGYAGRISEWEPSNFESEVAGIVDVV